MSGQEVLLLSITLYYGSDSVADKSTEIRGGGPRHRDPYAAPAAGPTWSLSCCSVTASRKPWAGHLQSRFFSSSVSISEKLHFPTNGFSVEQK